MQILVWFRNRLKSAGLEQVLSHTEKSCTALPYRQFSMNIKVKIIKLNTGFVTKIFQNYSNKTHTITYKKKL